MSQKGIGAWASEGNRRVKTLILTFNLTLTLNIIPTLTLDLTLTYLLQNSISQYFCDFVWNWTKDWDFFLRVNFCLKMIST